MLKRYRKQAGFTQAELAKKLGYKSAQFVSNWERGVSALPVDKFKAFSKHTGCPISFLVKQKTERTRALVLGRVA